jgi:hypothetical protein
MIYNRKDVDFDVDKIEAIDTCYCENVSNYETTFIQKINGYALKYDVVLEHPEPINIRYAPDSRRFIFNIVYLFKPNTINQKEVIVKKRNIKI